MNINYTFPATKGIQAGKEFFTATVAFKYLVRLFRFDDESVPAELRAQRNLSEARAKGIADYILANPTSYVLPAITASCDKGMAFQSLDDSYGVGLLQIPIDSMLLINDGQHRRKGIELALQENPSLADQSVSVTMFYDGGLLKSQQMFSDINSNACKPSGSLNALYDLRNPFSRWVLDILDKRPAIKSRIDMEAAAPAKRSSNLWSLVAFHMFINLLTGVNAKNIKSLKSLDKKTEEVLGFLDALNQIPYWKPMLDGNMSGEEVREKFVISHAVFLHGLAILGAHTKDWSQLAGLSKVEPAKFSDAWKNRCVVHGGKMSKTTNSVKSTAAVLMKMCGVTMPADIAELDALCIAL